MEGLKKYTIYEERNVELNIPISINNDGVIMFLVYIYSNNHFFIEFENLDVIEEWNDLSVVKSSDVENKLLQGFIKTAFERVNV